jgi:hypothetical protein
LNRETWVAMLLSELRALPSWIVATLSGPREQAAEITAIIPTIISLTAQVFTIRIPIDP